MLALFPQAQPLEGFLGGLLIGLAGAVMLLGAGRVAAVSGLAARALRLGHANTPWSVAALFTAGLMLGAALFTGAGGRIDAHFAPSTVHLVIAGLLTGFGTRLGSGCTSGHGVCGISRLSPRSLVATATFILCGMITVAIVNALGGGWS